MEDWELAGNKDEYSSRYVEPYKGTFLDGKNVLFLGSSVTFGASSLEDGIPEYFGQRFDCRFVKEAVSGTTLVDSDETSYVSRLERNIDKACSIDVFICQLSTNDASQDKPLGEISTNGTFDTMTVTGAIEHIIKYVRDNWGCPIMFYTGSRYDSSNYSAMVARLYEIADKWDIGIIDLWNDDDFNNISEETRDIYMKDPIHPTKAGYMRWWCPEMEKQVLKYMAK